MCSKIGSYNNQVLRIDMSSIIDRRTKKTLALLVDDEKNAVDAMAEFLLSENYDVHTAHDGAAAVQVYMNNPADVLITDIKMPNGNGYDLINELRNHNGDLPVIICSGNIDYKELSSKGISTDNTIVLNKPISLSALSGALRSIMRKG